MVIAVDVDGTLFDGVIVAEQAVDALRGARATGHHVVIVTGRRWEELGRVVPTIVALTNLVVCEEGGVLVNVDTGRLTLLSDPAEPELLAALTAAGVPDLDVGHVVIGSPTSWLDIVTEARSSRERGPSSPTRFDRDPDRLQQGIGATGGIADLELDEPSIMAIGGATNDLPMFDRDDRRRCR